jgi:hypothetical protein
MKRAFCLPMAVLAFACGGDEPAGPTSVSEETLRLLAEPVTPAAVVVSTAIDQAGDVGRFTSLAIGPDGRRHITYYDNTKENLKYASCAGNCTSARAWTRAFIDEAEDAGLGSSLKIGPDGRRYVTYWELQTDGLRFATCPPTSSCTAAADWVKTTIDPGGPGSVYTTLALNPDGGKEVAYRGTSGGQVDLRYAVCHSGCGQAANWFRVILDQTGLGFGGTITSLTIGGDGRRHLTYFHGGDEELRYATCASNCTNALMWQKSLIDGDGAGLHSSFVLAGPFGLRHVSYYNPRTGDLTYARCGSNCTAARSWKKVTVASTGDIGLYPSLAVEPNLRVHLSFYGSSGTALYYATCATNCFTASSWSKSVLDGLSAAVGEHPSLAVRDGVVEISYYDHTNGDLRYLKRTP